MPAPWLPLALLVSVLSGLAAPASADLQTLRAVFDALQVNDSSLFAGSVMTVTSAGGYDAANTIAMGVESSAGATATPTSPTTAFRTNGLSELFLILAFGHLEDVGGLPFDRRLAIPATYLPPPYQETTVFENPNFPGSSITLETLFFHTSSLSDRGFDTLGQTAAPTVALTLSSFVESFFAQAGGAFWLNLRPGMSSSYSYARINVALATYVLEQILARNATITQGTVLTADAFIQEVVIAPYGLTGTYLLSPAGAAPTVTYPVNSGAAVTSPFTGATVEELDSAASGPGPRFLQAAYTAELMYYTTVADVARLMSRVMLSGDAASLATYVTQRQLNLSEISDDRVPAYYASRTYGLYIFDPVALCTTVTSLGAVAYCNMNATDPIFGLVADGPYSQVSVLCTSTSCVSAFVGYPNAGIPSTKPPTLVLQLSGAALFFASGLQEPSRIFREGGDLYGLYVFLGVLATIIVAIALSYITDYFIQPTPIIRKAREPARPPGPDGVLASGPIAQTPGMAYGGNSSAHQDDSMATPNGYGNRRGLSGGGEGGISPPPLRRFDAYDS